MCGAQCVAERVRGQERTLAKILCRKVHPIFRPFPGQGLGLGLGIGLGLGRARRRRTPGYRVRVRVRVRVSSQAAGTKTEDSLFGAPQLSGRDCPLQAM